MAIPAANSILTTALDHGSDNPRDARAQLKTLLDKVRELIEAIDSADGLAKLDGAGRVQADDLFAAGSDLRMVVRRATRTLEHARKGLAAGIGAADGSRFITRLRRDAQGHVVAGETAARRKITSLTFTGLHIQVPFTVAEVAAFAGYFHPIHLRDSYKCLPYALLIPPHGTLYSATAAYLIGNPGIASSGGGAGNFRGFSIGSSSEVSVRLFQVETS